MFLVVTINVYLPMPSPVIHSGSLPGSKPHWTADQCFHTLIAVLLCQSLSSLTLRIHRSTWTLKWAIDCVCSLHICLFLCQIVRRVVVRCGTCLYVTCLTNKKKYKKKGRSVNLAGNEGVHKKALVYHNSHVFCEEFGNVRLLEYLPVAHITCIQRRHKGDGTMGCNTNHGLECGVWFICWKHHTLQKERGGSLAKDQSVKHQ